MKLVALFVLSIVGAIQTVKVIDESKVPQDILDGLDWVPEGDVRGGLKFPVIWDSKKYSLQLNQYGMLELIPRDLEIKELMEDAGIKVEYLDV
ncbi:hypothetical protein pipiens_005009 [Culex pipiens pipiens]|uniref:Uncharacterized protein n=1 Tax=Culex pipiens pipiens TaxID=38569 RepID=A0ABD1CCM4_CULPP